MDRPTWTSGIHPLSSVKGRIIVGFGLLVVILAGVVAGSAWLARKHQSDLATMEHHTAIADLLQDTEIASGTSATYLYGYVTTGNELLLPTLNSSLAASRQHLDEAAAIEQAQSHDHVPRLEELDETGNELHDGTEQLIAMSQAGERELAVTGMQAQTPKYMQWLGGLTRAVDSEQEQVSALKSRADRAGDLAFWLLVVSGAAGAGIAVAASVIIARSIVKPLSSLETTAIAVTHGDMEARSGAAGPRELAQLGDTLNSMMAKLQERDAELRASNEELRERNRQLVDARTQAATDALTGLLNHRAFHLRIKEEMYRAQEIGCPIGLVMLDIDGFKAINDSLGHLAGDEVLRDVGSALADAVGRDRAYRYGGDEFAILLPGTDSQETTRVAERVRSAVAQTKSGNATTISASLGIASFPDTATTAEELVYGADAAMYWAKSAGKNRVANWGDLRESQPARTPGPAEPSVAGTP
jgi:diguanylate cyclase (GGDEF)-like protein